MCSIARMIPHAPSCLGMTFSSMWICCIQSFSHTSHLYDCLRRRPGNNICMCRWVVNNPGTWLTAGSFLWDFLRVGWLRKHLPAFQSAAEQDHIRSRVNGNKSVGRIIADPRLLGKSSTLINYFLQIFSTKKLKWVGAKWTMLINVP